MIDRFASRKCLLISSNRTARAKTGKGLAGAAQCLRSTALRSAASAGRPEAPDGNFQQIGAALCRECALGRDVNSAALEPACAHRKLHAVELCYAELACGYRLYPVLYVPL